MILGVKVERGCRDCGERDPVVLDLHHVRGEKHPKLRDHKNRQLTRLSLEELAVEIEKCDVLYANCHRREEARLGFPNRNRGGRPRKRP